MRYFEILSQFYVSLMILVAVEGTSGSGKLARFNHFSEKLLYMYVDI